MLPEDAFVPVGSPFTTRRRADPEGLFTLMVVSTGLASAVTDSGV
jgi:hypothetical protein